RGHGSVGLRGFLALVAQVREVVSFSLRTLDHVREIVLGIALVVVRVDHDELDALSGEFLLDRDRAVFPRLHVGTVVAPEGDDENRFVLERTEGMRLSVHSRQGEVRGRRPERETLVLGQFHGVTRPTKRQSVKGFTGLSCPSGALREFLTQSLSRTRWMVQSRDLT